MDKSAIEWTDATWNPVSGCTKVSPGCVNCYAEAITLRFRKGGPFLPGFSTITSHRDRLNKPLAWKSPRKIFVNSMSDLFHEDVSDSFIEDVFAIMAEATQHTFQILTKRHERLSALAPELEWPSNVWIGVSVENQHWADNRIPALLEVPANVRFLSVEPLLQQVDLRPHLAGIDWVIVGGESGPRARKMRIDWVRDIREACSDANVSFFFKQWGGRYNKAGGRTLDGRTHDDFPQLGSFEPPRPTRDSESQAVICV